VARYADACNLFAPDLAFVAQRVDVLARHCEAEGRDPATIEKTIIWGSDALEDVGAFISAMEGFARLGITKVWVSPPGPDPVEWVSSLTEATVPALAAL
jgi:hypothetical protein